MTRETIRQVRDLTLSHRREIQPGHSVENDLRLLDDAANVDLLDNGKMETASSCPDQQLQPDPYADERDDCFPRPRFHWEICISWMTL